MKIVIVAQLLARILGGTVACLPDHSVAYPACTVYAGCTIIDLVQVGDVVHRSAINGCTLIIAEDTE